MTHEQPIPIRHATGLSQAVREEIEAALRGQRTLEDVVRWGRAQRPQLAVAEVVKQDEYTHDVVVPWRDGLWLAFETT